MNYNLSTRRQRILVLGLFAILGVNSWLTEKTNMTDLSSGLLTQGTTTGNLGGDGIGNALNACKNNASGMCAVTVTQKSGGTTASMTYRVALRKVELDKTQSGWSDQTLEAGPGATVDIDLMGCASCGEKFTFRTRDASVLLAEAAKAIAADSKERVRRAEQDRLDRIALKKQQDAADRCEVKLEVVESGELRSVSKATKLTRSEKLECMKDKMSELDDKEQQAYFETHLMPLLNDMMSASATSADREALRAFAKNFDVGNAGMMSSVRVMARASQYQDATLRIAAALQANPRNTQAQAALTTLQGQIAQDMLLATGSVNGRATELGLQTGAHWQNTLGNSLASMGERVRLHQHQHMTQLHQRHAAAGAHDPRLRQPYDPRFPQRHLAGRRPGPVPRPVGNQHLDLANGSPIYADPCYNGRSSVEACDYTGSTLPLPF